MSSHAFTPAPPQRNALRRGVSILLAFLLAAASILLIAPTANAVPGVTTTVLQNGSPLQPGAEVREGDVLKLRMQYTAAAVGQEVEITLAPGVTVSNTFPNNEAVESITPTANGVKVKFKDPWPDIAQGILDLDLVVSPISTSGPGEVKWNDGTDHTVPVVFVKNGDQKQNVQEGYAKAVNPTNLDSYVLKDADGNYLGLNPAITGKDLDYTLTINTPEGATLPDGYTVSDLLPAGLGYAQQPVVVTGTERTWDAAGYNPVDNPRTFVVDDSDGDSFSGHVQGALVGPSSLKLTYTVRVDDVAALDAALQQAFDNRAGAPGRYEISLTNTATYGGSKTATATVKVGATVAGPCVSCGDLGKTGDLTTVNKLAQSDGTLLDPQEITYTLHASLARWDGHSPNFVLDDNVVIEDNLLTQASWKTGAGFLSVSGSGPITSLTEADPCPATASAFADDQYVGKYCVTGQKLLVNVGKNPATNVTIAAKAQLNTVAGLTPVGTVEGGDRYLVRNTAKFNWGSSNWTTPNVDGYVVVPDASGEPVNDSSAFAKTAPGRLSTAPNQPLEVPYTFTVNSARTGVPATSTKIVDYVDTRYFDVAPDLSNVTVSGDYKVGNTTTQLTAADFELTRVGDDIEIVLSNSGKTKAAAANGTLTVKLTLTTFAFDGKQTIDIRNRADLFGNGPDALYESVIESQGTSYGAESETRKHVFDRVTNGGEWSQLLVPEEGADPIYVYRLQFIGHPGFGGVAIDTEKDVLPDGLEFIGFVNEADKATGANAVPGPVDTDEGNLVATFDPNAGPNGTINLTQRANTTFPDGDTANVYFAARLTDETRAVVNDFGNSEAVIVPGGPSIDIEKWTEEGDGSGPSYDRDGVLTNDGYTGDFDRAPGKSLTAGTPQKIRFTVSNDGPEALRDITVSDELDSGSGRIADLVCTFPGSTPAAPVTGTQWAGPFQPGDRFECTGTLPALKPGQTHADTASVTGTGVLSGRQVDDSDSWNGHVKTATAPRTDPDDGDDLPVTGSPAIGGWVAFAALAVAGGGLLLLRRRRV